MRVSLNLYNRPQPNFTQHGIIKNDEKKTAVTDENMDSYASDVKDAYLSPSIITYHWYEPKSEPKQYDYSLYLDELNSYIINTSPRESFDPYPETFEKLRQWRQGIMNSVILFYESPRDLVQYYSDYCNRLIRRGEIPGDGALSEMISDLECKIDFDMLGLNKDDLSLRDKVKFGALFDFWSVTPDGQPRNGYKKPDFVRSAEEYMELFSMKDAEQRHKLFEPEFAAIKGRFSSELLKKDDEIQKELDAERKEQLRLRKEMPFFQRTEQPLRAYSPVNTMKNITTRRKQAAIDAIEAKKREEELEKLREENAQRAAEREAELLELWTEDHYRHY